MLLGKPRIHLEDFQDMLNFESEQEEVSSPTFGQSGVVELKFDNMEDFPVVITVRIVQRQQA